MVNESSLPNFRTSEDGTIQQFTAKRIHPDWWHAVNCKKPQRCKLLFQLKVHSTFWHTIKWPQRRSVYSIFCSSLRATLAGPKGEYIHRMDPGYHVCSGCADVATHEAMHVFLLSLCHMLNYLHHITVDLSISKHSSPLHNTYLNNLSSKGECLGYVLTHLLGPRHIHLKGRAIFFCDPALTHTR